MWRKRHHGSSHPIFRHWSDGVFEPLRDTAVRVVAEDKVRLHDHAAAVTSSQVFALNLFLPWRHGSRASLDACLSTALETPITVDRVAFEWIPPGQLLGEIDGAEPRGDEAATATDVVLWGHSLGKPVAILLEVKLGEGGFTGCGGKVSPANTRPDVCASAAEFLRDPAACYLRRPRAKLRDRRYWEIFAEASGSLAAAFPGGSPDGPCWFAGQNQQPMRNYALAQALVQERIVSRAWFGLCAHDNNPDVARHWASWAALLGNPGAAPVVPASRVIAAGRCAGYGEWADWMATRYLLAGTR
jgi:hypothetical protein